MRKLVPHFGPQQAIQGVKSIDNWFTQHTNGKADWDSLIQKSVLNKGQIRKREETSPLRYDEKFVEICKSVPIPQKPNINYCN